MSITSKTDRFGIDVVIEELQQMSEPRLLAFWSGIGIADYNSYPRANKNWKDADKIPEISLDEKEYQEVLFADTLAVTSFWMVSDQRVFSEATKQLKTTISIIFQANLVKIYGQTNRADEEFNMNVLNVFKKDNFYINSDIEIVEGIENVYSDLTFSEEINNNAKKHNMSDFHVAKFTFDVIHKPDCFPKLAPVCPPGGSPCSVTLNTDPLTDIAGGTSKDMTIRHEDDSPVVVTTITDTASLFIGEVPNPLIVLNTSNIFKTGADVSFRTNDDGQLKRGNGVDFLTLNHNNGFGTTDKLTDDLGTQIYASGVIVDWSAWDRVNNTVLCYFKTLNASASLNTQIDGQPYTRNSIANWFVCNWKELTHMFNMSVTRQYMDYTPFNHNVSATAERVWTSTLDSSAVGTFYSGTSMAVGGGAPLYRALLCRTYTLTELGL